MSCCPPDSAPYLKSTYAFKGHDETSTEGFEYYITGSSIETGLIQIPDVWGYHGGRNRNVADYLGNNTVHVFYHHASSH
jgi:hypothetical protein